MNRSKPSSDDRDSSSQKKKADLPGAADTPFPHGEMPLTPADRVLSDVEVRLAGIVDSAIDAIITVDSAQRIILFNHAAERMFRCEAVNAIGSPLERFIPERYRGAHGGHIAEFGRTGVSTRSMAGARPVYGLRTDGSEFPAEASISQVETGGQKLFTVIMRDITERKRVENELIKQSRILDLAPVMICDTNSRITFWGGGSEKLYGWSADEAEGKVSYELLQTVFPASLDDILRELYATGRWEGEITHTTSAGKKINVASTWLLHRDSHGEPSAILKVNTDITDIKLAERALRSSEQRYRNLFESNPQPMWVFDAETLRILEVNDAAVHHYGYTRDEFLVMTLKELRPAEDVELLLENLAGHADVYVASETWRHKKKDGTLIHVELSAHALEFAGHSARLVMAVDVTERHALEDQLRQSQKMEAVGMLAGGIAHDFNNLLTAINGYAELALRTLSDDNPLARHLREIKQAGGRAAGLTRQLLAFSRKQVMQPKVIDINTVIRDLETMLRRVISEDIELKANLAPDLGSVRADPSQLEQVIINLVINARDAMPQGGEVGIETANVLFDEEYVRTHLAVKDGPHIKLAISDTGVGMDAATRERVFEPFFTTKEAGKGTGLGLSTVYGIVKQSGGFIWVYSEPGHGTTFKIYLPRVDESAPEADLGNSGERKINGTETILLAEDDDAVRGLARELLEARGYQVLEAANGSAALLHIENHVGAIDLLLTDVIMPEISGSELAGRALKVRPELKVLYMSGYTDKSVVHRGVIEPDVNFIQKPFSSNDLTSKVRDVLDKGSE